MALIIAGRVVPMARDDPHDSGSIERVTKEQTAAAPSGVVNARKIDVGSNFVLPGFIDLHNHIGYNALPLWSEPKQKNAFAHHRSGTFRDAAYTQLDMMLSPGTMSALDAITRAVECSARTDCASHPVPEALILRHLLQRDREGCRHG